MTNRRVAKSSDVSEHSGRVTAVVVTFNSAEVIRASLVALSGCPDVAAVIVVDNASSDDTVAIVSAEFPDVQLIRNTENAGFGPANNQGLETVETDYGFVLNPDAIVDAEAVSALIDVAEEHPEAAIIGPVLREPGRNREKIRTGTVWQPDKIRIPSEREIEVQFLVGAALFMRMSHVRKSGFFDPEIFLFYEDDDICASARRAGYSLILTPRACVTHFVGESTPPDAVVAAFKQAHFTWSRLYLERKEHGEKASHSLAMATDRSLGRKQLLARLLRDRAKLRLLMARRYAVRCFLSGVKPLTGLNGFRETILNESTTDGTDPMQLNACDLCEQTEFQQISESDRHGQPLKTVVCRNCGLVRHAVVPTEEELQQFYSTSYREEYNGERTPGARRIMRAWNNGERICRQVAPLLESGSRVLEVGAGIGCTVKVFEKAGFAAEGIDPGGEFLKFSRDQLHTNVQVCSLADIPQNHQYDAVLLVHVIEHLRSPKQALQQIAGLIRPGGMFYVECPNLQAPFARRSQLFHTAHIHNYTPATLQMLGEAAGFRLRKCFGDDQDPNLQMLFQHSADQQLCVDTENYHRTLDDLGRTDPVPYHLRVRYVTDRIRKLGSYANELFQARAFVEDLIRECHEQAEQQKESRQRAA